MQTASVRPGRGGSPHAQRARAEQTRHALMRVGARMFGAKGFHATGAPELVAAADLTRGALYHHFAGKEGLFEAVFAEALRELNEQARGSVAHLSGDTWAQLTGSLQAYLALLAERADLRRILLIDGPALLGWDRWHAMQAEWVQAGLITTLLKLRDEGVLAVAAPEAMAILIQGAVNDAAMAIAHADKAAAATADLSAALLQLLGGLRRR